MFEVCWFTAQIILCTLFHPSSFALLYMIDLQDGGNESNAEVSKREKARLKRMEQMKKQKIQEILDAQNAAVDADMVSMFYM